MGETLQAAARARPLRAGDARRPTHRSVLSYTASPDLTSLRVADMYKLYKKLSKLSLPAGRSDPPRPSTSSALLSSSKSKPRPVKVDPPAVTSNPFSPVKNRNGKQRARSPDPDVLPIPSLLSSASRANPFKTPSKPKPPREPRRAPEPPIHELDEDPFPLIVQPNAATSSPRPSPSPSNHVPQRRPSASLADATEHPPSAASASTTQAKNAVTRARKRLRGEPVSPSPVKEKRPRVAAGSMPVQPALRFDTVGLSEDDEPVRRGDTVIEDTPAKPREGKKQFKVLFDEIAPPASQPLPAAAARPKEQGLARSRSASAKGLFAFGFASGKESGLKRSKSRALSPFSEHSDEDMDWDVPTSSKGSSAKLKAPDFSPSVAAKSGTAPKPVKNGAKIPKAMLPGKDDLWSAAPENATSASSKTRKRSRSPPAESKTTPKQALAALPLLPPSPPADAQQPKYIDKGKGRALARKKSKMLASDGEDSDDEPSAEDLKVKELPFRWNRHRSQSNVDLLPSDGPSRSPSSEPDFDATQLSNAHPGKPDGEPEETFDVRLPDDLKRVLALSPPPPARADTLVEGLLYGRRAHYDAARGGEVWGAGEFSGAGEDGLGLPSVRRGRAAKGEESEDEWEGEPVPWEVAEL